MKCSSEQLNMPRTTRTTRARKAEERISDDYSDTDCDSVVPPKHATQPTRTRRIVQHRVVARPGGHRPRLHARQGPDRRSYRSSEQRHGRGNVVEPSRVDTGGLAAPALPLARMRNRHRRRHRSPGLRRRPRAPPRATLRAPRRILRIVR